MHSDIPVLGTQFDLTQQVSVVNSGRETKTCHVPIAKVVDVIRNAKFKKQIERIRSVVAMGDEAQAKSLKLGLPAILWSGQFTSRKAADLIQHSGLIVADFDDLEENLQTVRAKLIGSPFLLLHFISPSGNGLKAVFRVSADPAQHGESFNAVAQHVYELTGEKIDPSGKDVSRICFVSYDPEIFVNPGTVATLGIPTSDGPLLLTDGGCCTDSQTHRLLDAQTHRTPKSLSNEPSWVLQFLPTKAHETNAVFFNMARKSRSIELSQGRPLSPQELRDAFKVWFDQSRSEFLSESFQSYFEEFCRIRSYVRTSLEESHLLSAWRRANSEPMPPESSHLSEPVRRLLALCAQLQLIAGNSSFYLSSHSAAEFFGVAPNQAHRWLRSLEGHGLLRCEKRGDPAKRKATEYRYTGSLPTTTRTAF